MAEVAPSDSLGESYHRRVAAMVALFVFLLDQATKWIVTVPLNLQGQPQQTIRITPFFNLQWVENRGVSLGLLTADSDTGRWLLVLMTAAIALFVAFWAWREKKKADALALALILGGALGNILDRVRFGFVVDFADLHIGSWRPFLVFNVADAAITIGVVLLLARALLMREGKPSRKEV